MRGWKQVAAGGIIAAFLSVSGSALADDAAALAKILTGSYSSERSAAVAPDSEPETLRITPIWPGRADGHWMYVERADLATPDTPSRQEIWHLRFQPHRGGTEVRIFAVPNPDAVVGAWRRPDLLRGLVPDRLTRNTGCELLLQRRREYEFSGGTPGMDCRPPDSDAHYVLVQANVESRGLTLWERGFNRAGEQISGPAQDGPRFDKVAIGDVKVDE